MLAKVEKGLQRMETFQNHMAEKPLSRDEREELLLQKPKEWEISL